MALGNYIQKEKNNWRYQAGSGKNEKAWRNLFHKSSASGFDSTKECLAQLLSMSEDFENKPYEFVALYAERNHRGACCY